MKYDRKMILTDNKHWRLHHPIGPLPMAILVLPFQELYLEKKLRTEYNHPLHCPCNSIMTHDIIVVLVGIGEDGGYEMRTLYSDNAGMA